MNYQGFTIEHDEDGFFWHEGGYFATAEECRADIADWNQAEELHERERLGYHYDSPCLPDLPAP